MEKIKEKLKISYEFIKHIYKKVISNLEKDEDGKILIDLEFLLGNNYKLFIKKFIIKFFEKINISNKNINQIVEKIINNIKKFLHEIIIPESYQTRVGLSLKILEIVNK